MDTDQWRKTVIDVTNCNVLWYDIPLKSFNLSTWGAMDKCEILNDSKCDKHCKNSIQLYYTIGIGPIPPPPPSTRIIINCIMEARSKHVGKLHEVELHNHRCV